MISPASIQEVIQRSDIVEIIGQFISLKKRGVNYLGNCPFHNEKTPSFNVNPSKGIFKCFGCGKGGDVVSFVEEYEKFTFYETIRWLANYYRIELQETEVSDEYKQQQQIEESLRIINEYAAKYFEQTLWKDDEGQLIGLSYFKERGFTQQTIQNFKLGYSKEGWDNFYIKAIADGYTQELLERAGLIKKRDGGQYYDTYRGRVMFPILSPTGKVLGFGARILKTDGKQPKYVNSQENEVYVKNKVLYGLFQSRNSISKEDECLLVEGYTDVISLHQAGVTNVVASSGTSLTEGQLKLISNLTKNLTIIYDGDAAGIKAALRGLDKALGESFNVKLVLLPSGEDPDSYIKKIGEREFRAFIMENKQDIVSFRLEIGLKEIGNDPIKKSQLVNDIAETISKINKLEDFALRSFYIQSSAQKLGVDEQGLVNLVNKYIREQVKNVPKQPTQLELPPEELGDDAIPEFYYDENGQPVVIPASERIQPTVKEIIDSPIDWALIRILIEYGNNDYKNVCSVGQYIFEEMDIELLIHPLAKQIYKEANDYYDKNNQTPPLSYFVNHQNKEIRSQVAELLNDKYVPSEGWRTEVKIEVPFGAAIYESELDSIIIYFQLKLIRNSISTNLKLLQQEKNAEEQLKKMRIHQKLKEQEKELEKFVILK